MTRLRPSHPIVLGAAAACCSFSLQAQTSAPVPVPQVVIIGTTPLPGTGSDLRDVPANVQTFSGRDLARQRQGNLAEFLENNPTSVTVNAAQGNPYQLDISFRGFTASPLLGVPQGLSVFQDGVRINEPFGDVVNWDLLPQSAIEGLQLIPGSNPLFGLNTLGGALAIETKRGRNHPGGSAELSGGSFGRRSLQVEQGGESGPWDWFATANLARDSGWAEHNPSRVAQFYGKAGWRSGASELEVSLTAASNRLEGTQTLPASWLDTPRQAYTYPDTNENRAVMLAAKGTRRFEPGLLLGGNVYLRRYRNHNTSSNVNDTFGEVDPGTGLPDPVQALNDRSAIDQTSYGMGLQLTADRSWAGRKNQFVLGASGDFGRARFTQEAQPAAFTPSRAAEATGDYAPDTDAQTRNHTLALFVADTLALTPEWSLTASGRFNAATVSIRDRSGNDPALNGDHDFKRFNPALGLSWNPSERSTWYAGYNEGMRAPTAIELTCADPLAPCKLPNSFLADPPLKKVVARTLEFGARGKLGSASHWSAALYRTELQDDIQFVSSGGAINAGFFQNVGKTRRQGIELTASTRWDRIGLVARYSWIEATYASAFVENSPNNSSADANGDIVVPAGARIPGIPRQSLRLRLDAELGEAWRLGANLAASGPGRARGDENNLDARGTVPGYAVINFDAEVRLSKGLLAFARLNNAFDRRYANFGILGQNVFANAQRSFDPANPVSEVFLGQGAPRGLWLGLRCEWE
jgi:outer membrane receptor protein involved in Fe transport